MIFHMIASIMIWISQSELFEVDFSRTYQTLSIFFILIDCKLNIIIL